ncbi:unnamed protein product, partial [Rotaria magnacalcarata]
NHTTTNGRSTVTRHLTQYAFGACLSGTLVHFSDPTSPVQLNVFTYDENSYTEGKYKKVDEIPNLPLTSVAPMLCTEQKEKKHFVHSTLVTSRHFVYLL